ncbi:GNAT family N-acetyltransferase [Bacillus sp. FJAT-42376]|uniref:GNAT family N-acetyltransferase n=1 Tax=Bacillus sp. FJAT-42376 TaxID=2014076 RepID=UPI0013DD9DA9|nr:GNAT family N-acetyltransferase [Bacillus sp. FJAT-42376]
MRVRIAHKELPNGIEAKQASNEDKSVIAHLLKETAQWLHSKGSSQWNELITDGELRGLSGSINRGEVFLFAENGEIAGMVMLLTEAGDWDKSLWGDTDAESVYLHKLITARSFKGTGLGKEILLWAEKGIEFEGKKQIRLDCIGTNAALNQFYLAAGYEYKGTLNGFCKYEKPLTQS